MGVSPPFPCSSQVQRAWASAPSGRDPCSARVTDQVAAIALHQRGRQRLHAHGALHGSDPKRAEARVLAVIAPLRGKRPDAVFRMTLCGGEVASRRRAGVHVYVLERYGMNALHGVARWLKVVRCIRIVARLCANFEPVEGKKTPTRKKRQCFFRKEWIKA